MPALRRAGTPVHSEINGLLGFGKNRPIRWINAHGQDIKILPDAHRNQLKAAIQSIEHLRAEHGTVEIDQSKNDRLAAEILPQRNQVTMLVMESKIELDRIVELLIHTNLFKQLRTNPDALRGVSKLSIRGRYMQEQEQR